MNILERPIPASSFKVFQAIGITRIFKNFQAHKSWKFLQISTSIFLQVATVIPLFKIIKILMLLVILGQSHYSPYLQRLLKK